MSDRRVLRHVLRWLEPLRQPPDVQVDLAQQIHKNIDSSSALFEVESLDLLIRPFQAFLYCSQQVLRGNWFFQVFLGFEGKPTAHRDRAFLTLG